MMQVYGMKIIGLAIHSALNGFNISNDQLLTYLDAACNFMPLTNELNLVLLDSTGENIDKAVVLDAGVNSATFGLL